MRKTSAVLLMVMLTESIGSVVLLGSSRAEKGTPKARKLMTYPGYDERLEMEQYTEAIEGMISKIKQLRKRVSDVQNDFETDSAMVTQMVNSQMTSIKQALDFNQFVKKSVENIAG